MIRLKHLLAMLSAVSLFGASLASAGTLVIVTINVNRATEQYYKVQDFVQDLTATQEQATEKMKAMQGEGQAMVLELEELVEQAQSDILNEEARAEAQEDAIKKRDEVQAKENELRQFAANTQRSLQTREQTQMNLFFKEINEVIQEVSRERGAHLVLDVAGATRNGLPTVLYSDPSFDITDEVVARINADKPEESEEAEE